MTSRTAINLYFFWWFSKTYRPLVSEDTLSRNILHNYTARDASSGKYATKWVMHAGKRERVKDHLFQSIVVASMVAGVRRVAFVTVLSSRLWEIAARSVSNTLMHIYWWSFHVCCALSPTHEAAPYAFNFSKQWRLQESVSAIRQQTLITSRLIDTSLLVFFGFYLFWLIHNIPPPTYILTDLIPPGAAIKSFALRKQGKGWVTEFLVSTHSTGFLSGYLRSRWSHFKELSDIQRPNAIKFFLETEMTLMISYVRNTRSDILAKQPD